MRSSNKEFRSEKGLVLLGKVLAPHGLKGFVKVESYAEADDIFRTLKQLLLEPPGGVARSVSVEEIGTGQRCVLLKFKGIDSLQQAQRLAGSSLSMNSADLDETGENEYYWFELIGLDALDENGNPLGAVENLFRTGAHDILVIQNRSEEILVPAVSQYVQDVQIEQGVIIVRVPEEELP